MPTDLLPEIEAFLERENVSKTAFGKAVLNDGKFVDELKQGRRIWPETAMRVRQYIRAHSQQRAAS